MSEKPLFFWSSLQDFPYPITRIVLESELQTYHGESDTPELPEVKHHLGFFRPLLPTSLHSRPQTSSYTNRRNKPIRPCASPLQP